MSKNSEESIEVRISEIQAKMDTCHDLIAKLIDSTLEQQAKFAALLTFFEIEAVRHTDTFFGYTIHEKGKHHGTL